MSSEPWTPLQNAMITVLFVAVLALVIAVAVGTSAGFQ
jgi:ABC-type dipeptide/oligopeptide/nickel transport system permease subunit